MVHRQMMSFLGKLIIIRSGLMELTEPFGRSKKDVVAEANKSELCSFDNKQLIEATSKILLSDYIFKRHNRQYMNKMILLERICSVHISHRSLVVKESYKKQDVF